MKFFFSLLAIFMLLKASAQDSYKRGDVVADFSFKKILNNATSTSSLKALQNELTVIDFFGTWCIPCVRALPHLKELQSEYKSKVTIILVSNEEEQKLTKFIDARKPFSLPVVVDNGDNFISLFQPPSYPYTIVLNKQGKIIDVTDAASLKSENINEWLQQKNNDTSNISATIIKPVSTLAITKSANPLVSLSQQFIYAAKTGESVDSQITKLKNLPYNELKNGLASDAEKKAFWINLYNGYTQMILKSDPDKYKDRNKFFKAKQIEVAGKIFSLDDIEHGILRRSKIKWSLGYLNKLFPGKTEKDLRVDTLDYRIHFALNCGAKSCPPIAFYNPENLNQQLDLATKSYLAGEAEYNAENNVVKLPALMNWFRRDFGGKKKMKLLLKKIKIIPEESNPKIKFKKYDWDLFLDHYKTNT
ncbi:MAG: DUF547 domain-containing protein [Bacteroidota bacterium]|nr:DUF547 domain-containing protein [Bacteroidota bacterium]